MPETTTPSLAYGTRETLVPRRRWFHVWALPLLWLPGSIGSCIYYGDEYGAFAMAHLPAVLPLDRAAHAFNNLDMNSGFILAASIGLALMALLGAALDVLRASRWTWIGMVAVAGGATYGGCVSITPKWWASGEASVAFFQTFFVVWCWGAYTLAGAALVITPVLRVARRKRRGISRGCTRIRIDFRSSLF